MEASSQTSQPQLLTITEAQFDELYPDMAGCYSFFNSPPPPGITPREFEERYLANKLWRLNNCYTIINKDGLPVRFRMNYAQHKVYAASRQHPRVIILKSRQQGISTLWLISYFDDAVFAPFFNIGLMAQGTDEASTLLERAKFLWDTLDDSVKAFIGVKLEKDNSKEFAFSNNSTIFIRVSFRSTTLQRLHVSEFGKIANSNPQRAKETKTGTLQALAKGNTGIIESTAEGRNEFKLMWDAAVLAESSGQLSPKDFYPVFLSWLDDPDCVLDVHQTVDNEAAAYFQELELSTGRRLTEEQRNFWVAQRRELAGDIYQEYPATPEEAFTASRDGTYYSRKFVENVVRRGRVMEGLYDENLPCDVYFDLGVDDYMVMGYVQWYRGEYRIVKEYWNNGYDLEHYLSEAKDSGLEIRNLVFPHDIKQRQLMSGAGGGKAKTRLDLVRAWLRENHWRVGVRVLAKSSIADGIEATRAMIPHLWIDPSCTYLIDCFYNYSKEWDHKLQVWKPTPLHDEFSHGADVLRSIAVGMQESEAVNNSRMAIPDNYRRRSGGHDV